MSKNIRLLEWAMGHTKTLDLYFWPVVGFALSSNYIVLNWRFKDLYWAV